MAARKPKQAKAVVPPREDKAERPSYDNKAVAPAASVNVRIRVLKAHDGLEAGSEWLKPQATAKTMQTLGYWEIL